VRRFYADRVEEEWNRQFRDTYGRLEFDTTMYFIDKYLLGTKKSILDAGGGPGRYTIELARRGHDVVLLDPVAENLRFAEKQLRKARVRRRVRDVIEGSIEDLSAIPNNSFDFVLCLSGPLSHLTNKNKRVMAASELVRILKKKGLLFVSVIGRLSNLVLELESGYKYTDIRQSKRLRDEGDYEGERIFTAFHGFLPSELRQLFEELGTVKICEVVGIEGIGSTHPNAINTLARDKRLWKHWMETHYKTCAEPSVVGLAEHILLIARKR